MPYCTRAQVKTALPLAAATDDAWIDELIAQAQAFIDGEISHGFDQQVGVTRVYDGNGTDRLLIDDCVSLTSVTVAGVNVTSDTLLGPANSSPGFVLIRKAGQWDAGKQNVSVVGTFGYPSVPLDITRAAVRLVVHWYKQRDANYATVTATNQFGQSILTPEVPKDVDRILCRYRPRTFRS